MSLFKVINFYIPPKFSMDQAKLIQAETCGVFKGVIRRTYRKRRLSGSGRLTLH